MAATVGETTDVGLLSRLWGVYLVCVDERAWSVWMFVAFTQQQPAHGKAVPLSSSFSNVVMLQTTVC